MVVADIDADKVARLAKGDLDIFEEGLPELVSEGLATRRLRFVVAQKRLGLFDKRSAGTI